jgi:Tfp pilus assembly protein PilF
MYSFRGQAFVRPFRLLRERMRARPRRFVVGILLFLALVWGAVNSWAWWHLQAAGKAFERDQIQDAQSHLENNLRVWPNSFSAHLLGARIERRKANFAGAEKHLASCKMQRGSTEEVQMEWLLLRAQSGEFEELEPGLLKSVADNRPEKGAVLETLAIGYLKQNRLSRARAVLDQWLKDEPDRPRALFLRGWTLHYLQQRDEAYRDFKRALELTPDSREIRLRLADFLLADKNAPEAAEHLHYLQRQYGEDPGLWLLLGILRVQQGNLPEARWYLDQVLGVQPDHVMALSQRAEVEIQQGDTRRAEAFLRRALRGDPGNSLARYALYRCLQQQPGRARDAKTELAIYKASQEEERASKKLLEDLERFPRSPDLLAKAAKHFLSHGMNPLAEDFVQRALSVQPDHPLANEVLAELNKRKSASDIEAQRRRGK